MLQFIVYSPPYSWVLWLIWRKKWQDLTFHHQLWYTTLALVLQAHVLYWLVGKEFTLITSYEIWLYLSISECRVPNHQLVLRTHNQRHHLSLLHLQYQVLVLYNSQSTQRRNLSITQCRFVKEGAVKLDSISCYTGIDFESQTTALPFKGLYWFLSTACSQGIHWDYGYLIWCQWLYQISLT